jgi:hypothetical protein
MRADQSAPVEERDKRKRRLLKGSEGISRDAANAARYAAIMVVGVRNSALLP